MHLAILCDLFGMVKWPFGKVKWPPTRGWRGHFEWPGTFFTEPPGTLVSKSEVTDGQTSIASLVAPSGLKISAISRPCFNSESPWKMSSDQNPGY